MTTLDPVILKRNARRFHEAMVNLSFELCFATSDQKLNRLFFDQLYVLALHWMGQAVKEALDQIKEEEDARRRMQWEGGPHGD